MSRQLLVLLLIALGGCASTAQRPPTPAVDPCLPMPPVANGERFFLTIFGSQRSIFEPKYCHSWATIVKTCGAYPKIAQVATISWMPATLDIRPLEFCTEPGVNLDLHPTCREMLANGERIVQFGPYEIRPQFYHRLLVHKQFLESGQVRYQAIDSVGEAREGAACDCIHAITDADPDFDRSAYPLFRIGIGASRHIMRQLIESGQVISKQRHEWLNGPLGLTQYPIELGLANGLFE